MVPKTTNCTLKFSIIIPTFNRADIIGRAIESCLSQTFQNFEVIVIDDGSSDNTQDVVEQFSDPRISYFRQENSGGAVARNHGADRAQGEYLAFLDSDDAFSRNKLEMFLEEIQSGRTDTTKTVYYSPLCFYRGDGNEIIRPDRPINQFETVGEYLFAYDGLLQTSTLVMRRDVFQRVRFDDTLRNLQDLDLCLRLEAEGIDFHMLTTPLVTWFDVAVSGRISYSTKTADVTNWASRNRHLLNDRAYSGFLARYVAPRIAKKEPRKALQLLKDAVSEGAISYSRAGSLFFRGIAPETYSSVRDKLVTILKRSSTA